MTPLQLVRKQPELVAAVLATAGLAWWWTVRRMAGMDAGPGTGLGTLGWFTGIWVVMMAAMMLPSFTPTLGAYVTVTRERDPRRWLLFVCGYLLVWTAAGVAAYGAFALGKSLFGSELAWHRGGRWVAASVAAAAAAYELMPLKQACLKRCRGQLRALHGGARPGWWGALAMGARSGGWCIGCSWALMAALFALGVMSLTWMALVAVFVVLEKVGPWPRAASVANAVVLGALSIGVLADPSDVPGLVIPGSPPAIRAMRTMDGMEVVPPTKANHGMKAMHMKATHTTKAMGR